MVPCCFPSFCVFDLYYCVRARCIHRQRLRPCKCFSTPAEWAWLTVSQLDEYHPVIGIVVFILLFFQPILGCMHHVLFKKYQTRTFWSYAHLWLGRIVITLGIINGGLGFKLADTMGMGSKSGMIAYSVVAALMWSAWAIASIIGERRRKTAARNAPPKYTDSPPVETRQRADIPHPEQGHYAPR